MQGKRGVIMGLLNNKSIAWGIASSLAKHGADLAFTYQREEDREKRVKPLAASLQAQDMLFQCDVSEEGSVARTFAAIKEQWGTIDFVVHSLAFADKDELKGEYLNTSRKNFLMAMDISCYSFVEVCREASKLMPEGGSFLTLSYFGAEKVMPNYNVMGVAKAALEASVKYLASDLGRRNIRVNAISAGPIKTLAAHGIDDFKYILNWNEHNSPLKRNVTIEEVGDSALYFLSDLSRGVTAEIHHVDSGYNVIGMKAIDAPDIATVLPNVK